MGTHPRLLTTRQMLFQRTKDQILQRMRRKQILSQISKKNLTLKLKLKTIREQLAPLKYQKKPLLQKETKTNRLRLLTNIQPAVMVQTQKAKKTSERAVILIWTIKSV